MLYFRVQLELPCENWRKHGEVSTHTPSTRNFALIFVTHRLIAALERASELANLNIPTVETHIIRPGKSPRKRGSGLSPNKDQKRNAKGQFEPVVQPQEFDPRILNRFCIVGGSKLFFGGFLIGCL